MIVAPPALFTTGSACPNADVPNIPANSVVASAVPNCRALVRRVRPEVIGPVFMAVVL